MSGAGSSEQTGPPDATGRLLASQDVSARLAGEQTTQLQPRELETSTAAANMAAIAPVALQPRQSGRSGLRSSPSLPPAFGHQVFRNPRGQQQLQNYGQQLGFQYYHPQRSAPFQQGHLGGQLTPYGWLPYNLGYQIYGDQFNQQGFYQHQEGHLPGQLHPYQLPFQEPHDLQSFPLGRPFSGGSSQGFMPPPYIPHAMPHSLGRGRPVRSGKAGEENSDSYNFDPAEASNEPERARTTLMLRNIPNKYTIHMLLGMLDKCHKREPNDLVYDFCYLPIDFKNRCNLGYAFVNFVDAKYTSECYSAFNAKRWNDFNSKKVCEVKYARVQGKEALVEHFRNSKFPTNDVDCLPLLFEKITAESGAEIVRSVPLHSRQGSPP